MKPLQLSMKAFGAFAEECRIDFTPFDKSGIYLITGETGAGKTTILMRSATPFMERQAAMSVTRSSFAVSMLIPSRSLAWNCGSPAGTNSIW